MQKCISQNHYHVIWNDNTLEFSRQEMSALLYVFENASFFFLASHLPLCHSFISQPPSLLSTLFLLPFFLRKTAVMLLDDSTHSWRAYSDPGTYKGLTCIQILTAGRTHTQYIQICLGGRNLLSGFRKDFCYSLFWFFFIHFFISFCLFSVCLCVFLWTDMKVNSFTDLWPDPQ